MDVCSATVMFLLNSLQNVWNLLHYIRVISRTVVLTKEVKDKKSAEYLVSDKWFYRKQQSLLTFFFFFLLSFSLSAHQSGFTLVNRDIPIVFKQVTESTIT